jgi:hypothetical protein
LIYIQRILIKRNGDEFLAPSRIIITDGEKAWSGMSDPDRDGNYKGTSAKQFWAAVCCAFRNEQLIDSSTTALEWRFDPEAGKISVNWDMKYDDHIVLKNRFEASLIAGVGVETIKVGVEIKQSNRLPPMPKLKDSKQKLICETAFALLKQRKWHEERLIKYAETLCKTQAQRAAFEKSNKDLDRRFVSHTTYVLLPDATYRTCRLIHCKAASRWVRRGQAVDWVK